jgi:hypothetical protein
MQIRAQIERTGAIYRMWQKTFVQLINSVDFWSLGPNSPCASRSPRSRSGATDTAALFFTAVLRNRPKTFASKRIAMSFLGSSPIVALATRRMDDSRLFSALCRSCRRGREPAQTAGTKSQELRLGRGQKTLQRRSVCCLLTAELEAAAVRCVARRVISGY